MDEAEEDMEMAQDPFLEAGIDIPNEMPHSPSRKNKDNVPSGKATPQSSARQTPTILKKNAATMDSVNNSMLKDLQLQGSKPHDDLVVTITPSDNDVDGTSGEDRDPTIAKDNPSFVTE